MNRVTYRSDEAHGVPIPMRSDRFFAAQGAWYFATREGSAIGPFNDKHEAQKGLDDFIEFMTLAKPEVLSNLHNSLAS